MAGKVTNQAQINAAIAANNAAKAAAAAAQARITELQPRVAPAQTLLERTASATKLVGKISKKVVRNADENTAAILQQGQDVLKKQQERVAQVTREVLEPFSKASADLAEANAMQMVVPTPVYETGPVLAKDAFISTFKLIVGDTEGSKSYVPELYDYVSKYYKSGLTVAESLNLALRDAKTAGVMPAFTDRFKAVFALEDLKRQGKVVDVPTIAEYVKSEQALGEVLNRAGLGDLATEATLANVFSTGKSVAETTSIINDVFLAIDNAPTAWKANVAKVIPFADRTSLARAILLGPEGAQALQKTVAKAGVLTAAEQQGLTLTSAQQSELVASGESFGTSLGKFAQTRGVLDTAQKLKSMEMGIAPKDAYTQEQAMAATFNQSYDELQNLAKLSEREQARFAARPGLMGSKSLASQNRISY
jgi:hypothetical protein